MIEIGVVSSSPVLPGLVEKAVRQLWPNLALQYGVVVEVTLGAMSTRLHSQAIRLVLIDAECIKRKAGHADPM